MKDLNAVRKPNYKPWLQYLPKYPLIHTFRYGKDANKKKIADLFHMSHLGEEHDVRAVDAQFKAFFEEVNFVYLGIAKFPLGFIGQGEEEKKS